MFQEDKQNGIQWLAHLLLTQQNDEKHIPTYNHGSITPEMSPLSKESIEPGSLAMLFRFHSDLTYLSSQSDSIASVEDLGNPLPNTAV